MGNCIGDATPPKVSKRRLSEDFGTCCPECGYRQPHIHLGWLSISRGVLFTQVICKKCGQISLIIRFRNEPVDGELISAYDKGITEIVLPPQGGEKKDE